MNLVFMFPGQASQFVGMGKELYDSEPVFRNTFDLAAEILEMDIKTLCWEGPPEILTRTDNVQPAITAVSAACYDLIAHKFGKPQIAVGHSLGEYAALYAAGAFSPETLFKTVKARGYAMHRASLETEGAMTAILKLDRETIDEILTENELNEDVTIANINSSAQIIISGEKNAIAKAGQLCKDKGALKVIPLNVSGAWHSNLMKPAQEVMRSVLESVEINEAAFDVIANVNAQIEKTPDEIKNNLILQITSPVLWSDTIAQIQKLDQPVYLETGPGKVLCGILKGIDRRAAAKNFDDCNTLSAALEWLQSTSDNK